MMEIHDDFITAITDRTLTDIIQRTSKGYMNSEDWNRIEHDIKVVADLLSVPVVINTWDKRSVPTKDKLNLILVNLEKLRNLRKPFGIPEIPQHPINTYQKINDIEMILQMIHDNFFNAKEWVSHCGETYTGDSIGIL